MFAKVFSGVDVGEVDLDERYVDRQQGIAQRDAGVGKSGRVEDDEIDAFMRCSMDVIHELVLGIGLKGQQFATLLLNPTLEPVVDGVQSVASIVPGFPASEKVEIRPVQNQKFRHIANGILMLELYRKDLPKGVCFNIKGGS